MKRFTLIALVAGLSIMANAQITVEHGPVVLEHGTETALDNWTGTAHQLVHNADKPYQLRISDGTTVGGWIVGGDIHGENYRFIPATTNAVANGTALLEAINELDLLGSLEKKFVQLDVGEYDLGTNTAVQLDNITISGTPLGAHSPQLQHIFVAGSLITIATNSAGLFDGNESQGCMLKNLTFTYNENVAANKSWPSLFTDSQQYTIIDNCQVDVNMPSFKGFAKDSKFTQYVCYGNGTSITPKFLRCSITEDDSFTYEAIGTGYTFTECYLAGSSLFQSVGSVIVCQLYAYYTHFGPNVDAGNNWYAGGTVITKDGDINFCMGVPAFATNFTAIGGSYNTDQNYEPLPDF